MTHRSFAPWVEQLEGRALLSVMGGASTHATTAAPIERMALPAYEAIADLDFSVRTEDSPTGHLLVVEFVDLDHPRIVGIKGREELATTVNGSARLHQPAKSRLLELTISDSTGRQSPFLQVELDEKGHVLNHQRLLIPTVSGSAAHGNFHGTADQLRSTHASTSHRAALPRSSLDLDATAGSHSMDVRAVDEVFSHFGMPTMAVMSPYALGAGHSNMAMDTFEAVILELVDAIETSEHNSDSEGFAAAPAAAMTMSQEEEPQLDFYEVDLTEFSDADNTESEPTAGEQQNPGEIDRPAERQLKNAHVEELVAIASPRQATDDSLLKGDRQQIAQALHHVVFLAKPSIDLSAIAPQSETPDRGMFASISSLILSAACAVGALALDRIASIFKSGLVPRHAGYTGRFDPGPVES